jgi:hypothetical protein
VTLKNGFRRLQKKLGFGAEDWQASVRATTRIGFEKGTASQGAEKRAEAASEAQADV